jgi:Peptidase S46
MRKRTALALALVALFASAMTADEGMWTFDNFPKAEVMKTYKVDVTDRVLERLQHAVVRIESGCTGSIVSADGLVLTNHHCARSCLSENSTAQRDLVATGVVTQARDNEVRCQGEQASVLMKTENVTAKVASALAGAAPADVARRRNEALTNLESACEAESQKVGAPLKCEAVTLYQGGQYWLYKYKRYDDVRLAFAPEEGIAAFGGDPDNFQFPRWCLDMSLLRLYENGKPAATTNHLTFNWAGARDGEPVFVAGHPGTTERLLTVAQLKTQRDAYLPFWLLRYAELRGRLLQYSKSSAEAARTASDYLSSIENSIKVRRMQLAALLDDRMMDARAAEEQKLRQKVMSDPKLKASAGTAWEDIARAEQVYRDTIVPYALIEGAAGFNSTLLVRAAEESTKPNAERLREYTDAQAPQLRQQLAAEVPVYPEFEEVRLSFSLERAREYLGPDNSVVKLALGNASPDEKAKALISGSKLADSKVRLTLLEGGKRAIDASDDPMIALARAVDPQARALRKQHETEVEGPEGRAQRAIADARFAVYGTSIYPDATFTLRLSYGAVQGWLEAGRRVEPFTSLSRLYERATGAPPFEVPKTWLDAKPRLDMRTAVNFVTTNDIIGGNSGSPMVNAAGEIVGLVFDGNIHSISGTYWFDAEKNRTVAVHPAFIGTALLDVYGAKALAGELKVVASATRAR